MKFSTYHTFEKILECLLDSDMGMTKWGISQQVINVDYIRIQKLLDHLRKSKNIDYDPAFMRYTINDKGRHTLEVIKGFNEKFGFLLSLESKDNKVIAYHHSFKQRK